MTWAAPWLLASAAFSFDPDRADQVHAHRARPLAGNQADAAGGRMEQDGVAGLERIGAPEQVLHGQPCSIMAARSRNRSRPAAPGYAGRHVRSLAVGAVRTRRIGHAVAWLHVVTPSPTASTTPAPSCPRPPGSGCRIQAGAVIHVDEIQADRMVAHARLAGPGSPTSTSTISITSGPPVRACGLLLPS
jgi:hypothetical protein